jgi:hypothetical protein
MIDMNGSDIGINHLFNAVPLQSQFQVAIIRAIPSPTLVITANVNRVLAFEKDKS